MSNHWNFHDAVEDGIRENAGTLKAKLYQFLSVTEITRPSLQSSETQRMTR
jgi:hypothetical protein